MAEHHPNLYICPSKAHKLFFTKMRDVNTTSPDFVHYAKRSMRLIAEDALAEFPTHPVEIQTPCGRCQGVTRSSSSSSSDDICAVSIVRSGDCLLEAVRDIEPSVRVGKILIQRDESLPDKPAVLFYSKLPTGIANMHVLLCDPMLATGGSAIKALDVLTQDYQVPARHIIFANVICAPEGLQRLAAAYPDVKVVTANIDDGLNDEKYIVPGLGDYGDRFFNTA